MTRSTKRWLPRLVVESVVVMVSILIALVVDEWRESRAAEATVQWSLQSIRQEMEHNRQNLEETSRYHRRLADTLLTLAASEASRIDEEVRPHGWVMTPQLTSAAWHGANTTRATADMPAPVVLTLAGVYQEQEQYLTRREAIFSVLYAAVLERNSPSLLPMFRPLAGIVNDVAAWESLLLTQYDRAIEELDRAADESS